MDVAGAGAGAHGTGHGTDLDIPAAGARLHEPGRASHGHAPAAGRDHRSLRSFFEVHVASRLPDVQHARRLVGTDAGFRAVDVERAEIGRLLRAFAGLVAV